LKKEDVAETETKFVINGILANFGEHL